MVVWMRSRATVISSASSSYHVGGVEGRGMSVASAGVTGE